MLLYGLRNRCRIRSCGKGSTCVYMGVFVLMMVLLYCFVVMFCCEIWHFCSLYEKLLFCCCNSFV